MRTFFSDRPYHGKAERFHPYDTEKKWPRGEELPKEDKKNYFGEHDDRGSFQTNRRFYDYSTAKWPRGQAVEETKSDRDRFWPERINGDFRVFELLDSYPPLETAIDAIQRNGLQCHFPTVKKFIFAQFSASEDEDIFRAKLDLFKLLEPHDKSANLYAKLIEEAAKLEMVQKLWNEWITSSRFLTIYSAIETSYLLAIKRLTKTPIPKLCLEMARQDNATCNYRLFSKCIPNLKEDPFIKQNRGALDRAPLLSRRSKITSYEDLTFARLKTAFHQSALEGKVNKYEYAAYLELAKRNGSIQEAHNCYRLACQNGQADRITHMTYIDFLVEQENKENLELAEEIFERLREQPMLRNNNDSKEIELDLHSFSHGTGFIAVLKLAKADKLPDHFLLIHGRGSRSEGNYLSFKEYMQKHMQSHPLLGQWSWEPVLNNAGASWCVRDQFLLKQSSPSS